MILALVTTLVVVLVFVRGDDGTVPATASPSPSPSAPPGSGEPTPEKTEKAKAKKSKSNDLGDVRKEADGLFCRDLETKGYSYVAAVDYWRTNGQPNQMDADRNGIPCETVFPASDVEAYWGPQGYVPDSYSGIETLPRGLYCRDLVSRGYSYPQAVDYWWYNGMPDRMDEDRNGIPCETVYPSADVSLFWYG